MKARIALVALLLAVAGAAAAEVPSFESFRAAHKASALKKR